MSDRGQRQEHERRPIAGHLVLLHVRGVVASSGDDLLTKTRHHEERMIRDS
jgi:hypothetical protein